MVVYSENVFAYVAGILFFNGNGWSALQQTSDSSKGFNRVTNLTATKDYFEFDICLNYCHWYGDVEHVCFDPRNQLLRLLD